MCLVNLEIYINASPAPEELHGRKYVDITVEKQWPKQRRKVRVIEKIQREGGERAKQTFSKKGDSRNGKENKHFQKSIVGHQSAKTAKSAKFFVQRKTATFLNIIQRPLRLQLNNILDYRLGQCFGPRWKICNLALIFSQYFTMSLHHPKIFVEDSGFKHGTLPHWTAIESPCTSPSYIYFKCEVYIDIFRI